MESVSGVEANPTAEPSRRLRREIDLLTRRMVDAHPHIPWSQIGSAVDHAFADLADAPVQAYRSILAERDVRTWISGLAVSEDDVHAPNRSGEPGFGRRDVSQAPGDVTPERRAG